MNAYKRNWPSFDVVIIDEFHYAEASTYRRIMKRLEPAELVGLTATPERGDGFNVADEFFDGRVASELRLWDALEANLLVPFHYFGVADDVDLSQLEWKRGNYDTAQLSNLYIGNDARAAKVIAELRCTVTNVDEMRALGFCVSVQHANYMTEVLLHHRGRGLDTGSVLAAGAAKGYGSVSDLIVAVALHEVRGLQRKYNQGRKWEPVQAGALRPGRRTLEEEKHRAPKISFVGCGGQ